MGTQHIRIPVSVLKWLRETYGPEWNWHFKPTDSQLVTHALMEHKVNRTGKNINVVYDKKRKCLIYRER